MSDNLTPPAEDSWSSSTADVGGVEAKRFDERVDRVLISGAGLRLREVGGERKGGGVAETGEDATGSRAFVGPQDDTLRRVAVDDRDGVFAPAGVLTQQKLERELRETHTRDAHDAVAYEFGAARARRSSLRQGAHETYAAVDPLPQRRFDA
jgi:hypothetical protein